MMAETDQRDLLPRIAVPTLLIWGDSTRVRRSRRTPVRGRDPGRRARGHPGRRSRQQPRGPGPFNEAVRRFCRATRPKGPGERGRELSGPSLRSAELTARRGPRMRRKAPRKGALCEDRC